MGNETAYAMTNVIALPSRGAAVDPDAPRLLSQISARGRTVLRLARQLDRLCRFAGTRWAGGVLGALRRPHPLATYGQTFSYTEAVQMSGVHHMSPSELAAALVLVTRDLWSLCDRACGRRNGRLAILLRAKQRELANAVVALTADLKRSAASPGCARLEFDLEDFHTLAQLGFANQLDLGTRVAQVGLYARELTRRSLQAKQVRSVR